MFDFTITSIKHGWLDAKITVNGKETYLFASYLNDAPTLLLKNLNKLAQTGNMECKVVWEQEPSVEIWRMRKENDTVHFTVYNSLTPMCLTLLPQYDFDRVISNTKVREDLTVTYEKTENTITVNVSNGHSMTFINLDKIDLGDKGKFSVKTDEVLPFRIFFEGIIKEIGKYSQGENLKLYTREWCRHLGYTFPHKEYNKAKSFLK